MSKVNKETLKKEAAKHLNQGKTKQEVYEALLALSRNRSLVANVVRYTPTKKKLKKWGIWNTLFLVFISVLILLSLFQLSINIIWLVLLLIIVAMKRFELYYFHTIFGVLVFLGFSGLFFYQMVNEGFNQSLLRFVYVLPIPIVFIAAGIILTQKITPKFREKKEKYIDKHGRERIRIVHLFED
jgi:hypothetical protein